MHGSLHSKASVGVWTIGGSLKEDLASKYGPWLGCFPLKKKKGGVLYLLHQFEATLACIRILVLLLNWQCDPGPVTHPL